jgi:antitoxin YefM
MKVIKIPETLSDLSSLVEQINQDHLPRMITSDKGEVVLLSKQDWENLQETLYLQNILGFVEKIKEAEKSDDWVSENEFMRELDGMEN